MQEVPIPPDPNFVVDWQLADDTGHFIDVSTGEGDLIDLSTVDTEVVVPDAWVHS
jgi:hypothetical protein